MEQHSRIRTAADEDIRAEVDVTVVIVNYNVREFLKQALSSVYRARGDLEIEVIVVDNNSVDGSPDLVLTEFPDARLIRNSRNVGFGAANNMALRISNGRHILILNPDTIVQEDTLTSLVDFMNCHADAGAVGCKILNPDGTFAPESRRAFPTPEVAFYRMSGLSRLFPASTRFGRYNLTFLHPDETSEVDALSGSCMMIRRSALVSTLGPDKESVDSTVNLVPDRLFDEAFFMYGEDLDLCYRIQAAGWKIYYTPTTQIVHYKGESTRKGDLRYVKLFYGAMLLFAEKHFRQRSLVFRSAIRAAIMMRAGASATVRAIRRLSLPALDFAIGYLTVSVVGLLRFEDSLPGLPLRFLLTTPLIYGLAATFGIRVAGGYKRGRKRVRPVVVGVSVAVVAVASLSFFIKAIAFSRFVLAASVLPSLALLLAWRIITNRRRRNTARALVVGDGLEAARLKSMIGSHLRPPFVVVGFVGLDSEQETSGLPARKLGTMGQLRDIIRLHHIDEVIFATSGLPNSTIVALMSTLRDLPVEFKTFVERGSHVIGKAHVDDLSVPLISTEETYGRPGSPLLGRIARRLAASLSLVALLTMRTFSRRRQERRREELDVTLESLKKVAKGHLELVGWAPNDPYHPPEEWGVRQGAFSVVVAIPSMHPTDEEIRRAWQMYVTSRSLLLDLEIAVRGILRTLRHRGE